MASTRNKNTFGNYSLEQKQNMEKHSYFLFEPATRHQEILSAGNGFLRGNIPACQLSKNSVDIESFLRGINIVDLENKQYKVLTPEINQLPQLHMYEKPKIDLQPEPPAFYNNRPNVWS